MLKVLPSHANEHAWHANVRPSHAPPEPRDGSEIFPAGRKSVRDADLYRRGRII